MEWARGKLSLRTSPDMKVHILDPCHHNAAELAKALYLHDRTQGKLLRIKLSFSLLTDIMFRGRWIRLCNESRKASVQCPLSVSVVPVLTSHLAGMWDVSAEQSYPLGSLSTAGMIVELKSIFLNIFFYIIRAVRSSIKSCTPFFPQNNLNLWGHGLHKVSKALLPTVVSSWLQ